MSEVDTIPKSPDLYPIECVQITPEQVPAEAALGFLLRSRAYTTNRKQDIAELEGLVRVTDDNQDYVAYVACDTSTYDVTSGDTEQRLFIWEADLYGVQVGRGEVRFNISNPLEYFVDKPFVGYTETEDRHQRKGLGIRRLKMMNILAVRFFGHSLHSDTLMTDEAQQVWEKLEKEGLATRYTEGKHLRFRFL